MSKGQEIRKRIYTPVHMELLTQPGSRAFTRIDRDAISRHKARVKPKMT